MDSLQENAGVTNFPILKVSKKFFRESFGEKLILQQKSCSLDLPLFTFEEKIRKPIRLLILFFTSK